MILILREDECSVGGCRYHPLLEPTEFQVAGDQQSVQLVHDEGVAVKVQESVVLETN